jgi:UDP-glucose:(heptosyl)LPS alpha-1,3-glucosyltransferase
VGALGDLSPCLSAADVFLLPSIYDPFSNACLEAMAAGLPVITTDANGFAEVLKPGIEGEVLPTPSDIPALVQALKDWSDPARRAAIAPRLKKAGARFDIESNLKATVSLLTEPQA